MTSFMPAQQQQQQHGSDLIIQQHQEKEKQQQQQPPSQSQPQNHYDIATNPSPTPDNNKCNACSITNKNSKKLRSSKNVLNDDDECDECNLLFYSTRITNNDQNLETKSNLEEKYYTIDKRRKSHGDDDQKQGDDIQQYYYIQSKSPSCSSLKCHRPQEFSLSPVHHRQSHSNRTHHHRSASSPLPNTTNYDSLISLSIPSCSRSHTPVSQCCDHHHHHHHYRYHCYSATSRSGSSVEDVHGTPIKSKRDPHKRVPPFRKCTKFHSLPRENEGGSSHRKCSDDHHGRHRSHSVSGKMTDKEGYHSHSLPRSDGGGSIRKKKQCRHYSHTKSRSTVQLDSKETDCNKNAPYQIRYYTMPSTSGAFVATKKSTGTQCAYCIKMGSGQKISGDELPAPPPPNYEDAVTKNGGGDQNHDKIEINSSQSSSTISTIRRSSISSVRSDNHTKQTFYDHQNECCSTNVILTPSKITIEPLSLSSSATEIPEMFSSPSRIKWNFLAGLGEHQKLEDEDEEQPHTSKQSTKCSPGTKTVSIWRTTENDEGNTIIFHHESEVVENCCNNYMANADFDNQRFDVSSQSSPQSCSYKGEGASGNNNKLNNEVYPSTSNNNRNMFFENFSSPQHYRRFEKRSNLNQNILNFSQFPASSASSSASNILTFLNKSTNTSSNNLMRINSEDKQINTARNISTTTAVGGVASTSTVDVEAASGTNPLGQKPFYLTTQNQFDSSHFINPTRRMSTMNLMSNNNNYGPGEAPIERWRNITDTVGLNDVMRFVRKRAKKCTDFIKGDTNSKK